MTFESAILLKLPFLHWNLSNKIALFPNKQEEEEKQLSGVRSKNAIISLWMAVAVCVYLKLSSPVLLTASGFLLVWPHWLSQKQSMAFPVKPIYRSETWGF
jgi:hypothetical protein